MVKKTLVFLALVVAFRASAQVEIYRNGIRSAAARIAAHHPNGPLTHEEKLSLWRDWQSFLDYLLALDSTRRANESFDVTYAAFLAEYRGALEMIDATDAIPGADKVFNDAVPEIGLPANTYAQLKYRFLNVARATEYAAYETVWRARPIDSPLRNEIADDSRFILARGAGKGEKQTAANAMKVIGSSAHTAWFPVQKGVAEWMGHTRVARKGRSLISDAQIVILAKKLEPGDVMLERREWFLSNIGLPGYWPHTAMYIGTAAMRRRYFDDDDVRAWVRAQGRADGDFETLLADKYPSAYASFAKKQPDGHFPRVIEAMSPGVIFTTIEHSASADSLAVLRPRTGKRDKAIAIARAFHYAGRPYDFDFDFETDAALVCSELVYRAYEHGSENHGVQFPLIKVLGRSTLPPNEIARDFDEKFGTPDQQFDLVAFLDGHERQQVARSASVDDFRSSWRRPKWHILEE
jgi:hypothetical protein